MPTRVAPVINTWYRHLDKGQEFEVIDLDEAQGVVELQYFDGSLDQMDMDAWRRLEIEPIEPPEDWTGPVDDIERDDMGYTETDMEAGDWDAPSQELPRQQTSEPEMPREPEAVEEPPAQHRRKRDA